MAYKTVLREKKEIDNFGQMLCYAEGTCRFCGQKHRLAVFGRDEMEHNLIQQRNLKLIVLNTVCSSCIATLENQLKTTKLRLPCVSNGICGGGGGGGADDDDDDDDNDDDKSRKGCYENVDNVPCPDRKSNDETIITNKVTLSKFAKRCNELRVVSPISRHPVEQEHIVVAASSQTMQTSSSRQGRKKKKNCSVLTCEFCAKPFSHTGDLNKHRRKHTGEQPYECPSCQQRFSHASNLIRHRRVHSGERPFSCQSCNRTFARSDKLTHHFQRQCCSKSTVYGHKRE